MRYDIYYKINNDINLKRFLRENSYWYKELNRNPNSFKYFVEDMKVKYKLTTEDKINKTIDNINMLSTFLDVLK
ncbi:MAG: YlbE-like family protein [Bacilli bacterium]|nr:YlbE-like family protein [Bacilli bacterium]